MATKTRRLADLLANIDDNSKVTSAGLLDATITATDLAPNSVDSSELVDGAIDTSHLGDLQVTAGKVAANAVTSAKIADANITAAKMAADAIEIKPHIRPGMLYPSYVASGTSNKLLDGTTAHSGAFGTAQSDGRKYYYTNIAGSKPIKDPRIGAHFGSTRYMIGSRQLLEQETSQSDVNIYSFDGREFFRGQCPTATTNENNAGGVSVNFTESSNYFEITGYFNAVNLIHKSANGTRTWQVLVDGVQAHSALNVAGTVDTPLDSRFVRATSLSNIDITSSSSLSSDTTLGLHTLKMKNAAANSQYIYGIELIAHGLFTDATCDTNHTSGLGSPASTSKITMDSTSKVVAGMSVTGTGIAAGTTVSSVDSATVLTLSAATTATNANQTFTFGVADLSIPAQNVVSYGKKFSVSAAAHHYDPFNGFTNSSGNAAGLHSTYVDTATSLGLSTGTLHGASWAISGTNNIRPYNGGRVVKWIASDGTIKTSVNMMPPNAQGIGNNDNNGSAGIAAAEITTPSATNTAYLPSFSDDVIDNSLAEIATSFRHVEFGNGAANGNAAYKDFTQDHSASDIERGWCADDGVTALGGRIRGSSDGMYPDDTNDSWRFVFIGTGMSVTGGSGTRVHFQNLPYGTHVVKYVRAASTGSSQWSVDGVNYRQAWGTSSNESHASELHIHQPKMPPIPEDAVIISDYMLMADYVKSTGGAGDLVSKGIRMVSSSRDCFHDNSGTGTYGALSHDNVYPQVLSGVHTTGTAPNVGLNRCKLPSFGTQVEVNSYNQRGDIFVDTVDMAQTHSGTADQNSLLTQDVASTLGVHIFESRNSSSNHNIGSMRIVSPTHTSSHYQTFETPFLKELVGGDRNMEQTNLIVTPDGKSWDEVTRDTSYLGNVCIATTTDTETTWATSVKFDEWRGRLIFDQLNKDFAIAYDRVICLVDGFYQMSVQAYGVGSATSAIKLNGNVIMRMMNNTGNVVLYGSQDMLLQRGDYVQVFGEFGYNGADAEDTNNFIIKRLNK